MFMSPIERQEGCDRYRKGQLKDAVSTGSPAREVDMLEHVVLGQYWSVFCGAYCVDRIPCSVDGYVAS